MPWRRAWQPTRVLAWRIPWTEEPGELPSTGVAESDKHFYTEVQNILTVTHVLEAVLRLPCLGSPLHLPWGEGTRALGMGPRAPRAPPAQGGRTGRAPGQPCHHPLAQQDGRTLVPCLPSSRPPSLPLRPQTVAPKTRTEEELKQQISPQV